MVWSRSFGVSLFFTIAGEVKAFVMYLCESLNKSKSIGNDPLNSSLFIRYFINLANDRLLGLKGQ